MDEYLDEIRDLKRQLDKLREDEAAPDLIEEYDAEWRNLVALYEATKATAAIGDSDGELHRALAILGYGEWNFDNVYAFVYDAALNADLEGGELAAVVNSTDYAASLRAALD